MVPQGPVDLHAHPKGSILSFILILLTLQTCQQKPDLARTWCTSWGSRSTPGSSGQGPKS